MTAASGLAVSQAVKPPVFWAPLLKDAIVAGFVAVLLALPLVGLQTSDVGGASSTATNPATIASLRSGAQKTGGLTA